jgi:hypothetical protein
MITSVMESPMSRNVKPYVDDPATAADQPATLPVEHNNMVGLAGDVDTAEDLEPAVPPTLICISSGHVTLLLRDEQTSLGRSAGSHVTRRHP